MKKTLLALCAGIALSASAQTYNLGEAFAYDFNTFKWFDGNEAFWEENANWPAATMLNNASLAEGWGLGMIWFAGDAFKNNVPDLAACNEFFPTVDSPWTEGAKAAKVQVTPTGWWAYFNTNFALPAMEEVSRIRVVYRVDITEYARIDNANPFYVRLTDTDQDGCFAEPMFADTPVSNFWDNPGFRTVDLYYQPNGQTYLALTSMPGGISVDANSRPALYIQEVSVVPVSKLAGDTHVSGNVVSAITENAPAPVIISGEGGDDSINEVVAAAKVAEGIYDLQGRKLAAPVKGLNIINGVKTLVK